MDLAWAKMHVARFKRAMDIIHSVEMSGAGKESSLTFNMDGESSFTELEGKKKNITLGIKSIWEQYGKYVDSEGVWYKFVNYIRKHELCHVRYTGGKSYAWAVEGGEEKIYSYIATQEGMRSVFRNKRDLQNVKDHLVDKYGKVEGMLIKKNIQETSAWIANALEDGRIERVQAGKEPGFAKDRSFVRGKCAWMNSEVPAFTEEEIEANPALRLQLIQNCILVLATSQLYPKGFVKNYAKTPLMDDIKSIMPYISEGYLARSTRGMAIANHKICETLAPLMYEVAQEAAHNQAVLEQMKKMYEEMIRNMLIQMANSDSFGDSDADAEEDEDGSMNSALPFSDLEVTLPDDVYDKVMENLKKGKSSDENTVVIKREHPLPMPKTEEESDKNGSDSGEGESQSQEDRQSGQSGGEDKQQGSEQNSSAQSETVGDSKTEAEGESVSSSGGNEEATSSQKGTSGEKSENAEKTDEDIEKSIEAAIETASKEFEASGEDSMTEVAESERIQSNARKSRPVKEVASKPLSSAEVKAICSDFKEEVRKYQVDQKLPDILQTKGDALRKKVDRYFKTLQSPCVRHRTNGALDKGGISRLAKNKTDIFMKKSKNKLQKMCVYILIDNSGSMGDGEGSKRYKANMAAAVVEEGFRNLIPMKIVAFEERGEVLHHLVKDWDETLKENCCWNYLVHEKEGWGNEDDKDIAIATYELSKRPEEKKLLIVLSDGAPADTDATHDRIADARKKGICVSGIYFEDGKIDPEGRGCQEFKYMYEKDYVCCEASDIETNLAKVLEKFAHSR